MNTVKTIMTYSEKGYGEWVADDLSATLRNSFGTCGGGE